LIGKHPFLNPNGTVNWKKQLEGKYEKIETGKYSKELIKLMDKMMSVVCMCKRGVVYIFTCVFTFIKNIYLFV
jgi:hypothetical protein